MNSRPVELRRTSTLFALAAVAALALSAPSQASVVSDDDPGMAGGNDTRANSQSLDGFFSDQSGNLNIFPNDTNDFSAPIFSSVTVNGSTTPSAARSFDDGNGGTILIPALPDLDFYSFNGIGGTAAFFDIDIDRAGASPLNDPFITLFDSTGTALAFGDDINSPLDPGSTNDLDSFIGNYILPSTQRYFIAVNDYQNSEPNAQDQNGLTRTGLTQPNGATTEDGEFNNNVSVAGATPNDSFDNYQDSGDLEPRDYTLHVSLQNAPGNPAPVPEPGTMALMGVGLASLVAARRRKKEKPIA